MAPSLTNEVDVMVRLIVLSYEESAKPVAQLSSVRRPLPTRGNRCILEHLRSSLGPRSELRVRVAAYRNVALPSRESRTSVDVKATSTEETTHETHGHRSGCSARTRACFISSARMDPQSRNHFRNAPGRRDAARRPHHGSQRRCLRLDLRLSRVRTDRAA